MLSARLAKQRKVGEGHDPDEGAFRSIKRPLRRFYETLDGLYAVLLGWVIARRWRMR